MRRVRVLTAGEVYSWKKFHTHESWPRQKRTHGWRSVLMEKVSYSRLAKIPQRQDGAGRDRRLSYSGPLKWSFKKYFPFSSSSLPRSACSAIGDADSWPSGPGMRHLLAAPPAPPSRHLLAKSIARGVQLMIAHVSRVRPPASSVHR